ncbi:MAG: hypothetical protein WCO21_01340 [bacterium]|nr:hypothetical protein [Candidatus Jorgensenbacteria bacterium]
MDAKKMRDSISADADALVEKIRAYSRAQKDLWQLVPWLSLHAYAGIGRSDEKEYETAFRNGVWMIHASMKPGLFGSYIIGIDCATGEPCKGTHYSELADSAEILKCAPFIEEFDAFEIVSRLNEEHVLYLSRNGGKREQFCIQTADRIGLKEVFTRNEKK